MQTHSKSHTKSCRKYNTSCRFNFPRPPVLKTFIARVDSDDDKDTNEEAKDLNELSEKEFNKLCSEASRTPKQILADIWKLITINDQETYTFDEMLRMANVTYSQFKECITAVATRNTVHLERDLGDVWINNYNEHLSRSWNANTDIQYVTDAYACVAYILSYISKAEMEMGDLLKNAQKEAYDGNTDAADAMRKIGHAYLQNRELSAQEAVYRVSGLHLKECSRSYFYSLW